MAMSETEVFSGAIAAGIAFAQPLPPVWTRAHGLGHGLSVTPRGLRAFSRHLESPLPSARPCSAAAGRRTRMQSLPAEKIGALPSPSTRFYDFSDTPVMAIRATHCRLLSAALAAHVDEQIRFKRASLETLASQLSMCEETRRQDGDTGWHFFRDAQNTDINIEGPDEGDDIDGTKPAGSNGDGPPVFNAEFTDAIKGARPGELVRARMSYGWEVFVVTDVRHALQPTMVGAPRGRGHALSGPMRRRSPKPPRVVPRSYFIHTLGCQMNASDTERMAASLETQGYSPVDDPMHSALYILNTCALREHAQQKVYSYLGHQAQRKWDAPEAVTLIVAGCVAQQEGQQLLAQVPEVDIVMGPQYANRIADVMEEFQTRQAQIVATEPVHIHDDISTPKRTSRVTAWVNVIYGCLEKCSYCVVPNTRGLEQSRPMRAIRDEVEAAVRDGFKEVVLLGQNVDAYGRDMSPKRTLADLLRYIHDVEGLLRIRFTTGHPRYISDGLINTVAELPKVMEHFHIPPQSGDTDVLRDMRRGYSRQRYIDIARRIRMRLPDASICADMIVGFPGESDTAFENSLSLADEVVFDANMVRAYSARPNTQAALRDDQVHDGVKKHRLDTMNSKMRLHARARSRRFLGRKVEVLVEGTNEKVLGEVMGRERTNRVVFFPGDANLVGCVVDVFVEEAFTFSLRGRVVNVKS